MPGEVSKRASELVTMLEGTVLKSSPPRSMRALNDDSESIAGVADLMARVADLEAKPTGWVFTVHRDDASGFITSITAARLQ